MSSAKEFNFPDPEIDTRSSPTTYVEPTLVDPKNETKKNNEVFYHTELNTVLPFYRRLFSFKLFRLIKVWLSGTVVFLIFVCGNNYITNSLFCISVIFGLIASLRYDKKIELENNNKLHNIVTLDLKNSKENNEYSDSKLNLIIKTYNLLTKKISLDELTITSGTIFGFCIFIYACLLFLPCLNNNYFICIDIQNYYIPAGKKIFQASDSIIITIMTSTTATVISLFAIAANWLFKNSGKIETSEK